MSRDKMFSSIALVMNPQVRHVMLAIARKLKSEFASRIHLYCTSPQERDYYLDLDRGGLLDSVTDMGVMRPAMRGALPPAADVIAKARHYEACLGVTYNTLAVGDRHFGRGYSHAGSGHPRSRASEEATYLQMLHGYNTVFDFWERESSEKHIGLFLGSSKDAALVSRLHDVPLRVLFRSRYKSYHYWAANEYREHPALEQAYRRIRQPSQAKAVLEETYADEKQRRQRFLKALSVNQLMKGMGYELARQAYWQLRGYEKARGYYLRDKIALHWRRWRDLRRLTSVPMLRLCDLADRSFVFYPLHTEPEVALGVMSPEFFFQLTAISALSRDLPAGTILAVKESITGAGRRPAGFYNQILAHKNVVMLDVLEEGHEIVKKAAAVATITGTAGFEAAVQGVPVLSFGRHNNYNFLPHVKVITDLGRLPEQIAEVLSPQFDRAQAERDGARFLDAVVATSFDMEGYDYYHLDRFSERAVENAYKALVDSLAEPVGTAGISVQDQRVPSC